MRKLDEVLLVAAHFVDHALGRGRGDVERFERLADRRVLLGVDAVDLERDRVGRDEQAAEQRRDERGRGVVPADRLDHLGREAHHTERGGADLRVRRAELLELDLDQRRVGLGERGAPSSCRSGAARGGTRARCRGRAAGRR